MTQSRSPSTSAWASSAVKTFSQAPSGSPLPQPVVRAFPRAEVIGQVHPRGAGAVLECDRVDHLPVITPSPAPPRYPVWKQRLDPRPLGVSQRNTSTNDQMIRRKRPRACPADLGCSRGGYRLAMGSMGEDFRGRWAFVGRTLVNRPWLIVSWVVLAIVAVAAGKVVPQPWSAGVYPVVLLVALLLFSRASTQKE